MTDKPTFDEALGHSSMGGPAARALGGYSSEEEVSRVLRLSEEPEREMCEESFENQKAAVEQRVRENHPDWELQEDAQERYWVVQIRTENGDSWTSLHSTKYKADRMLQRKIDQWGLRNLYEMDELDYGISYLMVDDPEDR